MKRISTLLIIATMFAISSLAYDVQIDGIYYNLNNETKTAEVTYQYYSIGGDEDRAENWPTPICRKPGRTI